MQNVKTQISNNNAGSSDARSNSGCTIGGLGSGLSSNAIIAEWESRLYEMEMIHGDKKGVILTSRVHPGES
jgi:hypothetical protein